MVSRTGLDPAQEPHPFPRAASYRALPGCQAALAATQAGDVVSRGRIWSQIFAAPGVELDLDVGYRIPSGISASPPNASSAHLHHLTPVKLYPSA